MHSKYTLTEQAPSYLREFARPNNKTVKQTEQNLESQGLKTIQTNKIIKIAMSTMPIISDYLWICYFQTFLQFWNLFLSMKSKLQKSFDIRK